MDLKNSLLTKRDFEIYLRNIEGYAETTIDDYPRRVDKVCRLEGFLNDDTPDWIALSRVIHSIIIEYDKGGVKEAFGNESNRMVINALKAYERYIEYIVSEIPPSSRLSQEQQESPNPELDKLTVKAIIEKLASSNSPITYGELAKTVGSLRGKKIANQGFAYALGRVQDYCKELQLPSLPVLVVDQKLVPASGFISHYRIIHPEADKLTDHQIIKLERDACIECKNWQKLYDKVGIDEPVPAINNRIAEMKNRPIYEEGERITGVLRNEVKRNPIARARCLALKGHRCIVCEKDLEEVYGVSGIIHVHHLKPLFETVGAREVDPERDLVPVCPNCHAVIHSKGKQENDCYTPNEVRAMLGLEPLE